MMPVRLSSGGSREALSVDRGAANGRNLSALALKRLYRLDVHMKAPIPRQGRIIFAATNVAALDPAVLFATAPRPTHLLLPPGAFIAPFNKVLRATGQIPLHPDSPDRTAMLAAVHELYQERAVGIFPEPGRGNGSFDRIRHGIAYLQSRTNAPVVPVAIFGTRPKTDNLDDLPRLRSTIRVYYGEPFVVPPVGDIDYRATLASIGETIRQHLADHVREVSQSVYSDLVEVAR